MSAHNQMIANPGVSMSHDSLATLLKLIIQVVLYMLLVTGLFALLVMNNQSIAFPILEWAGVAASGVVAGLMARWRLSTHTQALKFLTAVLALAANLWILGLLTTGSLGFSASSVSSSGVNWRGLGQLGLGALLVWISLATKRGAVQVEKPGKPQAKGSSQPAIKKGESHLKDKKSIVKSGKTRATGNSQLAKRKGESRQQDKKDTLKPVKRQAKGSSQAAIRKEGSRKQVKKDTLKSGKPKPEPVNKKSSAWLESVKHLSDTIKLRVESLNRNHLQLAGHAIQHTQKEAVRRLKSSLNRLKPGEPQAGLPEETKITRESQKPVVRVGRTPLKVQAVVSGNKSGEIRLLGAIEHRCPFCLETVEKNDPRGVKICKICHTHHHADCWDVTGACQVPHHHG
jgi:hypothetical protein